MINTSSLSPPPKKKEVEMVYYIFAFKLSESLEMANNLSYTKRNISLVFSLSLLLNGLKGGWPTTACYNVVLTF